MWLLDRLHDVSGFSSSIVTSHTEAGDEVIKFWKVKVKRQGRWGGMRSTECPSSLVSKTPFLLLSGFGHWLKTLQHSACIVFIHGTKLFK